MYIGQTMMRIMRLKILYPKNITLWALFRTKSSKSTHEAGCNFSDIGPCMRAYINTYIDRDIHEFIHSCIHSFIGGSRGPYSAMVSCVFQKLKVLRFNWSSLGKFLLVILVNPPKL